MKKIIIPSAAFLAASAALFAQTLTITAPGYSAHELVTSSAGYSITALATDGAGRLFYFESDSNFSGTLPSQLWQVTFDNLNVGTPDLIHDFGANLSGSFLKYSAGQLFLGENTTNGLYAIDPVNETVDPLGTVPGNFDADFSDGALFVSNFSAGTNKITRFTLGSDGGGGLALSTGTMVLDAGAQSSGPLQFTGMGDLIYGSSAGGLAGGLYYYLKSEVAGGGLTLDTGHKVATTNANSYLADAGGASVWRDSYSSNELRIIDTTTANVTVVGTVTGADGLGDLDAAGGTLVVAVTDYGNFPSPTRIYAVAPEPSSALLLTLGLAALTQRRRRREIEA